MSRGLDVWNDTLHSEEIKALRNLYYEGRRMGR